MLKQHREFCRAAEAMGLRVLSMRTTGRNHCALRITNGTKELTYFIPTSSSDVRSMRNALADLRRQFKEKTDV